MPALSKSVCTLNNYNSISLKLVYNNDIILNEIIFRSSVGPEFAKNKAIFFLASAVILLIVGGGLIFFTFDVENLTHYWLGIYIG